MFARRILCGLLIVAGTAGLLLPGLSAADKNDKGNNNDQQQRHIQQLKQELNQAEKQIAALRQDLREAHAKLGKEKNEDKQDDKTVKALKDKLDAINKAGAVHIALYRLKDGSPRGEVETFVKDASGTLGKIKSARGFWAGKPASSGSAEADCQVAVVALFDDAGDRKKFLDDPAYKKFEDRHKKNWQAQVVQFHPD